MTIEKLGELAELGIEIKMKSATVFVVIGFYKSDTVEVDLQSKTITARYNDVSRYDDLIEGLVELNYGWWQRSKDRGDFWKNPDPVWGDLMVKQGLVEVVERVVKEYV